MSRIDELVADLCPDGVEYASLGEIGIFARGGGLQKNDFTTDGVGCIHYGQVYTHYGIWATETKTYVSSEFAEKKRKMLPGDVFIATTSENDEDLGKAVAWLGDEEIVASGDAFVFRHSQDPKYVSYFLNSSLFDEQKQRYITGTKVRRLSGEALAKIVMPVPPLEVQRAIVEILDNFTALEAELEAELEARKKQYEHYRNTLMLAGEGAHTVLLGDIATIGTGNHDTKDAQADGSYAFYARGREPLRLDTFDFDENAIITAGDGVGVGKVFHFARGKYALHQRAYRIVPNDGIDARFIYHYLIADFARYLERTSVHASVTSLRRPMFLKYQIQLPPFEEQRRIVEILDKFDALVNDLSSGLPAEIASRRKQYEYYRDQLLTFKELAS